MGRVRTVSRLVEIGLRFIGMWPDSLYPNLYWSMYMTMVGISQYHQYRYIYAHFNMNNFIPLMDSMGLAIANSLAYFKLFCLRWNRRIFHNILREMDRDWKRSAEKDSYMSIMMTVERMSHKYAKVLIGIFAMTAFFLSIAAYAIHAALSKEKFRELPVKMKFSFNATKSPLFEFILVYQCLYELSLASLIGMINALLATLVLHVGSQIDIIRQAVMEISNKNDSNASLILLRDLVDRHRNIISMSNEIERIFTAISLMQLLCNTLIICCAGFMFIIALSQKIVAGIIKSLLLYIAKTLEVFVFCYAGEYLTAKSKSISDAVYESFWYDVRSSEKHALLFIMMRAQKRLTITAGSILELTLDGFMSVMKTSASYMSILHAMY